MVHDGTDGNQFRGFLTDRDGEATESVRRDDDTIYSGEDDGGSRDTASPDNYTEDQALPIPPTKAYVSINEEGFPIFPTGQQGGRGSTQYGSEVGGAKKDMPYPFNVRWRRRERRQDRRRDGTR